MAGSRSTMAIAACVVVVTALAHCAAAKRFIVGGRVGWTVAQVEFGRDPNFFQTWAHKNYPFHTLDELVFRWPAGDSVLQVKYADFTACDPGQPIRYWRAKPGGGGKHMTFKLPPNYKYFTVYFISGEAGHCKLGQKMYIDVFE